MKINRIPLVFIIFLILLALSAVLSLSIGSVPLSFGKVCSILAGKGGSAQEVNIIMQIRLPRLIMAFLLGGALSLSGFLLQTYFQNPIAGPFVLGISSGAKMTVALALIFLLKRGFASSSLILVASAFVGALLSTAFILLVARKISSAGSLLVAGIMIGYVTSAVTDFLIAFAEDADIVNLHGWSKGSFSGFSMSDCAVSAGIILVTTTLVFLLAKPIQAFQLGESYAQSMGVNTKIFRPLLILLSSLLSATVTAFAGPVSFVGIAVPFLVKRLLLTSKSLVVIPASFLGGAVFCIISDLIARTVLSPMELSISTVTSVFGAPVVIFMLVNRRKRGK
ncbi:MAG: iron ABC transporter permease [Treponema sp.]|uniref:FecCD family ABC transporter permease n=1 Tax=Treponema sp. TaxID=166 RepID=UPI0025DF07E3|nr:iron ABC transporter permease [Treponema sp.]MBQ8678875.1 iron ABC transporter permease [Treponema sp.]